MLKIDEGFKLKDGRVLSRDELCQAHMYYERACTQEYIVEDMGVSEDVAWGIACDTRDIMMKWDDGDREREAIDEAMSGRGILCNETPVSETYEFYVYFPQDDLTYRIAEGSGDNLLKEDRDEGYVDYIDYDVYKGEGSAVEFDGGMEMLRESFADKFETLRDVIEYVIDMDKLKSTNYRIYTEEQIEELNSKKREKKDLGR